MVAHYRLDGNAEDSAGGNDGVERGIVSWASGPNARVGSGALLLEGQGYIAIAEDDAFDLTGSITLAAWIRTQETGVDATIVSKGDSAWSLGLDNMTGAVRLACSGLVGDWQVVGQTAVDDGLWHHVAGVYDAEEGQMLVYVDGYIDAQGQATGAVEVNAQEVWIGANPEYTGQEARWQGVIDNVRVFNYALAADEIFQQTTWHVDAINGRDTYNGQGRGRAFRTIQRAIDHAEAGDLVLVWPGVYTEAVIFGFEAITVRSAADAATIEAPGDLAVSFYYGIGSVLENFVIANSLTGVWVNGSNPTLRHVTLVGNAAGIEVYGGGHPTITHSIMWHNTVHDIYVEGGYSLDTMYCCIQDEYPGQGNFSADPLFADPEANDYHLRSEYGRFVADGEPDQSGYGGGTWVYDDVTSPCIDAGNPALCPAGEIMPNGGRLNVGAYGHTFQASRSPWPLRCDADHDGFVGMNDLVVLTENWLGHINAPVEY